MSIFEEIESINRNIAGGLLTGSGGGGGGVSTYNFTTTGATGRYGPVDQAAVNNAYLGTTLEGLVTWTINGIQEWTVPSEGLFVLTAIGASGGTGYANNTPGYGAFVEGTILLTAGIVLRIAVGQVGENASGSESHYCGGGGGGMSLITLKADATLPLICSGGGAGSSSYPYVDQNATVFENGNSGIYSGGGEGGTNRLGGGSGTYTGGGSGYAGNGGNAGTAEGGTTYSNGLRGGAQSNCGGNGGFGGGGASYAGGGGGGGYSGGGGGGFSSSDGGGGGGGGCYAGTNCTDVIKTAGVGTGAGSVVISSFTAAPSHSPGLLIPVRKTIRL